jgi:hypothetical protein
MRSQVPDRDQLRPDPQGQTEGAQHSERHDTAEACRSNVHAAVRNPYGLMISSLLRFR